jgi:hypothetical protein
VGGSQFEHGEEAGSVASRRSTVRCRCVWRSTGVFDKATQRVRIINLVSEEDGVGLQAAEQLLPTGQSPVY